MADKPNGGGAGQGKANGGVNGKNGHASQRLAGKVAIITGAGRGIGHATSLKFGAEGAVVIACDINADQAQQTARDVEGIGAEAMGFQMDVRIPPASPAWSRRWSRSTGASTAW